MYAALRSAEKLEQSENKGRAKLVCFKNGLKTNSKPFENIFVYNFRKHIFYNLEAKFNSQIGTMKGIPL